MVCFVSPGSCLFSSGQAFKVGQGFMPVGQAQSVRPLSFPQLTSPWQGPTLLSQGSQCFTQHLLFLSASSVFYPVPLFLSASSIQLVNIY